jgi:hypothetical protein
LEHPPSHLSSPLLSDVMKTIFRGRILYIY